jgi:hypothetical protein
MVDEQDDSDQDHQEKVRATFNLPRDLLEEARDTVVALAGPPHRLTLAKLAEIALRNELERLRGERRGSGRDKPYPARTAEVRSGRPIS